MQIAADSAQYCGRCGAYEFWEVMKLLRKEKDEDDGSEVLIYEIVCTHCGRPDEYRTKDAQSIPERARIREELMTPEIKFDPRRKYESDMAGFDPGKVGKWHNPNKEEEKKEEVNG